MNSSKEFWLKAFCLKINQILHFKISLNMQFTVIFYLIHTKTWGWREFICLWGFLKYIQQLHSQLFSLTISKAYLSNYTRKSR